MADIVNAELEHCVDVIRSNRSELERLGVTGLSISGSVARGESKSGSDVDVIIDFDPTIVQSIFDLSRIHDVLESELERPVDVLSKRALKMPRHRELIVDAVRVF